MNLTSAVTDSQGKDKERKGEYIDCRSGGIVDYGLECESIVSTS